MSDLLADLRNLQPKHKVSRLVWIALSEEGEVLEACPLSQLCIENGWLTPKQIDFGGDPAGVVYATIGTHYGTEQVKVADKFVAAWDQQPLHLIKPEHIAHVVHYVKEELENV